MKNIPLLQHEGIRANYKSLPEHPAKMDSTSYSLVERINGSIMSPEDKAEMTELVQSMAREPAPDDHEVFQRHIEYLIRLKETRAKE